MTEYRDLGFSRGHQGRQGNRPHDDNDNEEEDDEVEDNDNANYKGISALRLEILTIKNLISINYQSIFSIPII